MNAFYTPRHSRWIARETRWFYLDAGRFDLDMRHIHLDTARIHLDTAHIQLDTARIEIETARILLDTSRIPPDSWRHSGNPPQKKCGPAGLSSGDFLICGTKTGPAAPGRSRSRTEGVAGRPRAAAGGTLAGSSRKKSPPYRGTIAAEQAGKRRHKDCSATATSGCKASIRRQRAIVSGGATSPAGCSG